MGDAIFATPSIRALREYFPKARIVILVSSSAWAVLKNNPWDLELIRIENQWDLIREITRIRRENFDLALGLSQIGSYCAKLSNAELIVDFDWVDSANEYSVVQLCLEVLKCALRQLNMPVQHLSTKTEFRFLPHDKHMVDEYLTTHHIDLARPMVAIHCGGHHFNRKRWPAESFARLAQLIRDGYGCEVVCIGGLEDREAALEIQSQTPHVRVSAGELTLAQTAALLHKCQVMIGNDSGPLHLSVAVNTKTIGLFGPTDPAQFHPYDAKFHRVIYKRLSCSPCYRFGGSILQHLPRCSRAYCMENITNQDVLKEFDPLFTANDRISPMELESGLEPANRS